MTDTRWIQQASAGWVIDASVTMPWLVADEAAPFKELRLFACARRKDGAGVLGLSKGRGFQASPTLALARHRAPRRLTMRCAVCLNCPT